MEPVFGNVAITAARKRAQSALPDAPVVPYEESSAPRWRGLAVAFLRSSAQRRVRLADRLDPACA
jgi:hypothetical protein